MSGLPIRDRTQSVADGVQRIRFHPLVRRDIPSYGYIYGVKSGRLTKVPEATSRGRASWAGRTAGAPRRAPRRPPRRVGLTAQAPVP